MEDKNLKRNYIYNALYQVLAMVIILVTTPYVSRVLGSEGVGIYGYTYSIATYFILVGSLGIAMYGQRQIAYYKDDKEKYSKTFFELFIIKAIAILFSSVLFYFLYASHGSYQLYYKILMIELLGSIFDIMWFFQGMEDFKKVVIRNTVIRVVSVVTIFLFVKDSNDLWKYFLIYSGGTTLANLSLWVRIRKLIDFHSLRLISWKEMGKKHFKTILALLIPQISMQIYTVLDKTMIGGILHDMRAVGFYEQAQKIVKLALMIVAAFGTIIFSRMSVNYAKKNKKELNHCVDIAFDFVWLLAIPITFGIIAIAPNFVPWFFGKGYEEIVPLMIAFSPIVLSIGLSNVVFMQYLISTEKQRQYSIAVVVGALSNIVFNFLLIPGMKTMGAVISSIIAETTIMIIEMIYVRKEIQMKDNFKDSLRYFFAATIMGGIIYVLGYKMSPTAMTTLIQIGLGTVIYFSILLLIKDRQVWSYIKRKR